MPVIEMSTFVQAPLERVFDLSRSIDFHVASSHHTGEHAIGGVIHGLIELGQEVTWRAKHLGVWQELTSRITQMTHPTHFHDSMVKGAFRCFDHDHFFEARAKGTLMRDVINYAAPLGVLGSLANALFLKRYLQNFLELRNQAIKGAAESDIWKEYLPA